MTKETKYINHVIFAIDSSSSMTRHKQNVNQVFQSILESLEQTNQDTRVSIYTFADTVTCLANDIDISTKRPVVAIQPNGMTALLDGTAKAVRDGLQVQAKNATKKDEDHAFLLYVITDGEENRSGTSRTEITNLIKDLNEAWTVAILVPNQTGAHYAKGFGFPAGNIELWNVDSAKGFEEMARTITESISEYSTMRASGVRSTNKLFNLNTKNLTKQEVKKELDKVDGKIYHAQSEYQIRDFVEKVVKETYKKGKAYYELEKTETVQAYKDIVIVDAANGNKYGGANARTLLGIPNDEVKLSPGDFGGWRIFIQSTSVNRKISKGTSIFVKK